MFIYESKDIRDRLIFTIIVLIIVRIGCQVPIPGTDARVIDEVLGGLSTGAFGFFDAMTGSSFSNFSIFGVGLFLRS